MLIARSLFITTTPAFVLQGWTPENKLWMSTRGGDVLLGSEPGVSENFDDAKISSRGFGILDVGCAPSACGAG